MEPIFDANWNHRFLQMTDMIAGWSKDPSRGVGAVIVTPEKQILSTGFNGLPRGYQDLPERLERPAKYDIIVHAEMNAIIQCARYGVSPIGCCLFSSFSPCVNCAIAIVQSGIQQVVSYEPIPGDEHWNQSIDKALDIFEETGVPFIRCPREHVA